jgi:hypothetical protein
VWQPWLNGYILNVASVIKKVVPYAAESELERAFTTPKVAPHSELHSPNWTTYNPQRFSAQITPPHLGSFMKQSKKKDQK